MLPDTENVARRDFEERPQRTDITADDLQNQKSSMKDNSRSESVAFVLKPPRRKWVDADWQRPILDKSRNTGRSDRRE